MLNFYNFCIFCAEMSLHPSLILSRWPQVENKTFTEKHNVSLYLGYGDSILSVRVNVHYIYIMHILTFLINLHK